MKQLPETRGTAVVIFDPLTGHVINPQWDNVLPKGGWRLGTF
jgi:hypothetical protein